MYDSTTPEAIPADAEVVAGYIDGLYEWKSANWQRFSNARKLTIAVFAWHDADILDVENGDAAPDQAPNWIARQKRRAGGLARPVIYCNLSTIAAVREACADAGVDNWDWWAAHYTPGYPHLEAGSCATQWIDHGPNGENFDISLCVEGWPA